MRWSIVTCIRMPTPDPTRMRSRCAMVYRSTVACLGILGCLVTQMPLPDRYRIGRTHPQALGRRLGGHRRSAQGLRRQTPGEAPHSISPSQRLPLYRSGAPQLLSTQDGLQLCVDPVRRRSAPDIRRTWVFVHSTGCQT